MTLRIEKPAKTVLLALLTGAAVLVALSSPYGTRRLLKGLGYELEKWRERRKLFWTLAYLRRKKYISYRHHPDGTTSIVLTEDGRKRALHYKLETLTLTKPKRWDGKWRLVAFDVPEEKRTGRNALRNKLRELGLVQLQKSLWAWPYKCKDEVDFVAETFDIGPYVHYIVAESLTSAKFLEYKFHFRE